MTREPADKPPTNLLIPAAALLLMLVIAWAPVAHAADAKLSRLGDEPLAPDAWTRVKVLGVIDCGPRETAVLNASVQFETPYRLFWKFSYGVERLEIDMTACKSEKQVRFLNHLDVRPPMSAIGNRTVHVPVFAHFWSNSSVSDYGWTFNGSLQFRPSIQVAVRPQGDLANQVEINPGGKQVLSFVFVNDGNTPTNLSVTALPEEGVEGLSLSVPPRMEIGTLYGQGGFETLVVTIRANETAVPGDRGGYLLMVRSDAGPSSSWQTFEIRIDVLIGERPGIAEIPGFSLWTLLPAVAIFARRRSWMRRG